MNTDEKIKRVLSIFALCQKHNRHEIAHELAFGENKNVCIQCLIERNEQLENALKFYGNPDSYFGIGMLGDSPCGEFLHDFSEVWDEGAQDYVARPGKRAREIMHKK